MPPLDYRFVWNNYDHPALVAAFDMSTLTPGGLLKNLARTGAVYDATINGAPTYVPPLIRAKRTKCMDFGGVNEYLSLANPLNGLATLSMVCWINVDTLGRILFSRASAAGTYLFIQSAGGGSIFRFSMSAVECDSKNAIVLGRTYMVCATRDGTTSLLQKTYVDGPFHKQISTGANPVDANAFIGQYWDGSIRYDGRIDNIMFWNIPLTQEQNWSLMKSSIPRM